jgi:hypothetical protein
MSTIYCVLFSDGIQDIIERIAQTKNGQKRRKWPLFCPGAVAEGKKI